MRPPQHAYLDSRWSRLRPDRRAGALALLLGVLIFVGAGVDDRRGCRVLDARASTALAVLAPMPDGLASAVPVRLGTDPVGALGGDVWTLDRRTAGRWRPTWRLSVDLDGSGGRVRAASDTSDHAGVGLAGPGMVAFPLPGGLRSGDYRLGPGDPGSPAIELRLACRSGRIGELYGRVALALGY